MLGWTIGISRRGIAASLACIAISGVAVAQDMQPTPAPSTTAAMPAPNTAAVPPAAPAAMPPVQQLTQAQLDRLVAPIALYPDPLLAQILTASTYPLEVVEAARWVNAPANQVLKGDALTNALQAQNWDPSVKTLVPFPQVLENMSNQLQWTEELGNAFLAQQADVISAVQSLRHQAMAAGNLKQTPQCRCVIQTSGETISILPAEPQVVCVPVYRPVRVRGVALSGVSALCLPGSGRVRLRAGVLDRLWPARRTGVFRSVLGLGLGRLGASRHRRRPGPFRARFRRPRLVLGQCMGA